MLRLAEILLEPRPATTWAQLRQLGIDEATGVLPRANVDWRAHAPEQPWEHGPLALYKQQIEDAGFRLTVLEDNPPMDRLRLGLPGREEELAAVLELIRVMGKLGIEVWCYNWMPVVSWSRTSVALAGRAGAEVTGFDASVWADVTAATGGARRGGDALGDARLVPRARRPGRGGGGRQAGPPPGRPAALARPRHRPHHPHDSRPTTACSSSSRARPTG